MGTTPLAAPLTAAEFFARDLPGCSMSAAHLATGIAYSTVHDIARNRCTQPRLTTLHRLEKWSREAGAEHGVYISAARTLGFEEFKPTGTEG